MVEVPRTSLLRVMAVSPEIPENQQIIKNVTHKMSTNSAANMYSTITAKRTINLSLVFVICP